MDQKIRCPDFADLFWDFADLCSDFKDLCLDFADFDLCGDYEFSVPTRIDSDFAYLSSGFAYLCSDFADLCSDLADLCSDFADLCSDFADFDLRGDYEFSLPSRIDSDLLSLNIKP